MKTKRSRKHKKWQIQEAKAKFSQMIQETVISGYQTITKNGEPVAYLLSKEEFELYSNQRKSFLEVLDACPYPDIDLAIERSQETIRDIDL